MADERKYHGKNYDKMRNKMIRLWNNFIFRIIILKWKLMMQIKHKLTVR